MIGLIVASNGLDFHPVSNARTFNKMLIKKRYTYSGLLTEYKALNLRYCTRAANDRCTEDALK